MSKEQSEELMNKYLAAESSLEDEEHLFNAKYQPSGMREWSMYVKQRRKKSSSNFNDVIWRSVQNRRKAKQRFLIRVSGIAASILLGVAILFNSPFEENINNEEKEALLEEALSMFPDDNQSLDKPSIIYEDDMVIIYLASE